MKQELKNCIDELSEIFDYIAQKSQLDTSSHPHKYYFISSIVSSLYIEAMNEKVDYKIAFESKE